jgi:type IV secretory pathway VirB2 component (pilin)
VTEYGAGSEIAAELALEDITERVPTWFRGVAFTVLVLSVVTAVAALLAGMTAHETLLDRTEEIIDVSIAETDQLTVELLRTKHDIQRALDQPVNAAEIEQIERVEAEQKQAETEADSAEAATLDSASNHLLLATAATIAAVAIAVTGLAPIVRQRWLWTVGVLIGVLAVVLLAVAVVRLTI